MKSALFRRISIGMISCVCIASMSFSSLAYVGRSDVSLMKNSWSQDGEDWVYTDSNGKVVTGWLKSGGKWYYLDLETGHMLKGRQTIDGKVYCFDDSGKMLSKKWVSDDGEWLYLNASGNAVSGWYKISKTWYYFDTGSYAMVKGINEIDSKLYKFKDSGALTSGWHKNEDGSYYYFTTNGAASGWKKVGKSWYFFDPETLLMVTGAQEIDGKVYLFSSGGAMLSSGWQKDSNGTWYYLTKSGAASINTWIKSSGKWYYFGADGAMVTGATEIGGKKYYFNANGDMAVNVTIDGIKYGADGVGVVLEFGVDSSSWVGASNGKISNAAELVLRIKFVNIKDEVFSYKVYSGNELVFMSASIPAAASVDVTYGQTEGAQFDGDFIAAGIYKIEVYSAPDKLLHTTSVTVKTGSGVEDDPNGTLTIWSYNEEFQSLLNRYSDVDYEYTTYGITQYQTQLASALASGDGAPDLYICDAGFTRRFMDSSSALSINDLGITNDELGEMFGYTLQMGTDSQGTLRGLTWTAAPKAIFYNKTLTNQYLGVSDSADVEPYFSTWSSFLNTARTVNQSSNGNVKILPGADTFYLVSDDVVFGQETQDFLNFNSALSSESLTWGRGAYTQDWYSGASNDSTVAYYAALWMMQYQLNPKGTWGVTSAPVSTFQGGAWIVASPYCDMKASAAQIMRDITIDADNLTAMAERSEFVNNVSVMNSMASNSKWKFTWTGNESPVTDLVKVAQKVDLSFIE